MSVAMAETEPHSCKLQEFTRNSSSRFVQSIYVALSGPAMQALSKATAPVYKLGLPEYTDTLVQLTYKEGNGVWDAPKEAINKWLVNELQHRIRTSKEIVVVVKTFLLLQELILDGDEAFLVALKEQVGLFDLDKMSLSEELADKPAYAQTLRFFVTFVHGLYEFFVRQPKVRSAIAAMRRTKVFQFDDSALFEPDAPELQHTCMIRDAKGMMQETKEDVLNQRDCGSMKPLNELGLDGLALMKYIVVADTDVPNCFVAAEVFSQYVNMAKRLFSMVTHALYRLLAVHMEKLKLFEEQDVVVDATFMPIAMFQERRLLVAQYERMTNQLKQFFEAIEVQQKVNDRLKRLEVPKIRPLPESIRRYRAVLDQLQKAYERDRNLQQSDSNGKLFAVGGVTGLVEMSDLASTLSSTPSSMGSFANSTHPKTTLTPPLGASSADSPNKSWTAPNFNDFQTELLTVDKIFASAEPRSSGGLSSDDRYDREEEESSLPNTISKRATDDDDANDQMQSRFSVAEDNVLGRGGNGIVYRAWDDVEGRHVACKQILLHQDNGAALKELEKEYKVLTTLSHPNIVKVVGFVAHKGQGRIFMEWMPSGSVQSVLQETRRGLRDGIVRRYLREALLGLEYLHGRGIMHRDIKPGNMLLSAAGEVKLTDFGTVRCLETAETMVKTGTVVGTVPYLAPECIQGSYSAAGDIWAIGCTALHMATNKAPWSDEARDTVGLIFKLGNLKQGQLPAAVKEIANEQLRNLIEQTMTFERAARPSASALLAHPFFAEA